MASNVPLTGGYDCKFVETPPDKLMCQICLLVAHTPHQVTCCGRVYCKTCLDKHKRLSNTCPNCRNTGQNWPDIRGEWTSNSTCMKMRYSYTILSTFFSQVSRKSKHLRSGATTMVVVGRGSYDPWTTTSQHVSMLSFAALTTARTTRRNLKCTCYVVTWTNI